MATKHLLVVLAVVLVGLLTSCGHEEPTGTLRVMSDPSGADIIIDGVATGDVTPGEYLRPVGRLTVAVARDGFLIAPASRTISVPAGRRVDAYFAMSQLGEMTVTSTPDGASIWINGEDTGESTPHTFSLVLGTYEVLVQLGDFVADGGSRSIDVTDGSVADANFTMLPAGTLTVTSAPAGGAIHLNGTDTGEATPHTFDLAAGDYTVHLVKPGFTPSPPSLDVTVTAARDTTVDFALYDEGVNGTLSVTSVPAGASIHLDGADSGEITPHTFDLSPGQYDVAVSRRNFHAPAERTVTVVAAGDIPADFTLTPRKLVLIETVSAVNCVGCPTMHEQEAAVAADGYGPDKVVAIQYSQGWLGYDPHYEANPGDNLARTQFFYWPNTAWGGALPAMFIDGALSELTEPNFPRPAQVMKDSLDVHLAREPGFVIDVSVDDIQAATFTVSIDLIAVTTVNGNDAVLNVCVVETPVLYDTAPGSEGETEFHWIMREFETLIDAPLPISPDQPGHFEIDFTAGSGWVADNLAVIAFVQNDGTWEVLQAGITEFAHKGDH